MQKAIKAVPLIVIGALSVGAMAVMQPNSPVMDPADAPTLAPVVVPPLEKAETHVIQRGETLSGVLSRAYVLGADLAEVLLVSREHVNPRRLTQGAEITVRRWTTDNSPRAIEMRINADTTVLIARNEVGWHSTLQLTPVQVDTVFVADLPYEPPSCDDRSYVTGRETAPAPAAAPAPAKPWWMFWK